MFKCGTIIMNVKDVDTPEKVIKSVKKPREVLAMIDKQIDINRDRYNIRGRDLIGLAPGVHPGDLMDHSGHEDCMYDDPV